MHKSITILTAKGVLLANRATGSSGSALPGLVAEKISPSLLQDLTRQFDKGVILVTGTNGKTTVVKMIVSLLKDAGYNVFTNKTGSNFTRGILSALIDESSLNGRIDSDIAVLEVDEAYSRIIAEQVKPLATTVTNVMRDQLDRYGEIDKTADLIGDCVSLSAAAILNADDLPVARLLDRLGPDSTVVYYGVDSSLRSALPTDAELLGNIDESDLPSDTIKKDVVLKSVKPPHISIELEDKEYFTEIELEGVHNALNATAAVATVWHVLGGSLDISKTISALREVKPAFGRGEKIILQDRIVHIALAKNPGGFNQNVRTFIKEKTRVVLILVNDNYADSRDVSWLWDVNLDALKESAPTIIVGGSRAYDMALRLQYIGITVDAVETDISLALEEALSAGESTDDITVFPTYTAMLELRKILRNYSKVDDIW